VSPDILLPCTPTLRDVLNHYHLTEHCFADTILLISSLPSPPRPPAHANTSHSRRRRRDAHVRRRPLDHAPRGLSRLVLHRRRAHCLRLRRGREQGRQPRARRFLPRHPLVIPVLLGVCCARARWALEETADGARRAWLFILVTAGLIILFWFVAGGVALCTSAPPRPPRAAHRTDARAGFFVLFLGVMSDLYVVWTSSTTRSRVSRTARLGRVGVPRALRFLPRARCVAAFAFCRAAPRGSRSARSVGHHLVDAGARHVRDQPARRARRVQGARALPALLRPADVATRTSSKRTRSSARPRSTSCRCRVRRTPSQVPARLGGRGSRWRRRWRYALLAAAIVSLYAS
jgi:hypothetical protein